MNIQPMQEHKKQTKESINQIQTYRTNGSRQTYIGKTSIS